MSIYRRNLLFSDYSQTVKQLRQDIGNYYGNPHMVYVGKKTDEYGMVKDMYAVSIITSTMAPYVYLIVLSEPTTAARGLHLRGAKLATLEWTELYFRVYMHESEIPMEIRENIQQVNAFPLDIRSVNLQTRLIGYDYTKVIMECVPGKRAVYINQELHSVLVVDTGSAPSSFNNCDNLPHTLNASTALSNFAQSMIRVLPPGQ